MASKPPRWDAADATPEERVAIIKAAMASAPVFESAPTFNPDEWDMTRYEGTPEPVRSLVAGTLPLGKAGLVAAMGDTGKSMMLQDLALTIATCSAADTASTNPPMAFGARVLEFGTAVILSAEDDQAELHRRLDGIDPGRSRRHNMDPKRLRLIPFPNAGGTVPLIQQARDRLETTERFTMIRTWLKTLPNLKLVVIDPLAAFVQAALDNDNTAAAFTMAVFGAVAAETGACVVAAHHVRKADGEISNVAEARAMVRGATGLVDGSRFVYALWPAPDQQADHVCKRLEIESGPNKVVRGAVVKSNGPADRTIKLFVRDGRNGLLMDRTESERSRRRDQDEALIDALVAFVAKHQPGMGLGQYRAYGKQSVLTEANNIPGWTGLGQGKAKHLLGLALEKGKLVKDDAGWLRPA